jgi:hypothetical protein
MIPQKIEMDLELKMRICVSSHSSNYSQKNLRQMLNSPNPEVRATIIKDDSFIKTML